jgi:Arc-like DNA binding domain
MMVPSMWCHEMTKIEKRRIRLEARLPVDLRDWLAERAARFGTSINAEIIIAVRGEMKREQVPERD